LKDKEKTKNKTDIRWVAGGICIPAGLFIGMGIGWVLGHLVQGMFIGLGAGFFCLATVIMIKQNQ